MKTSILKIFILMILSTSQVAQAGFGDYLSSCLMGMGTGLVGAGVTETNLEEDKKISTTGYAAAGVLGCFSGLAYFGMASSQAVFRIEYELRRENSDLSFQVQSLL